jgi:hypothetical protein
MCSFLHELYENLVIGLTSFVVQGEIMKEDGEENLESHDKDPAQPGSDSVCSPESPWEDNEEVIPTFFSTMNTRYFGPFKLPGSLTLVSRFRNQFVLV